MIDNKGISGVAIQAVDDRDNRPKLEQASVSRDPSSPGAAFVRAFVDDPNRQDVFVVAVIPAYNEDRFIGSVVLKTRLFVDHTLVVDDGSADRTADVAQQAGALVTRLSQNQGKATALRVGLGQAYEMGAQIVVTLDGDGQHAPQEIPNLVRPLLYDEADIVVGSRFLETKSDIPTWRKAGQHALTLATNLASGVHCSDSQSGFRAFNRRALDTIDLQSSGFAIESEIQFWAREYKLRITEAPISVVYKEPPKRNPVRQAMQVLGSIVEMVSESRPLFFFSLIGLAAVSSGVGWWFFILSTCREPNVATIGYAMAAFLLIVLGALCILEGMTLHILRKMMQHLPNWSGARGPQINDGDFKSSPNRAESSESTRAGEEE